MTEALLILILLAVFVGILVAGGIHAKLTQIAGTLVRSEAVLDAIYESGKKREAAVKEFMKGAN